MASQKSKTNTGKPESVGQLIAGLEHPHKSGIEKLRAMILATDKRISEEIKWNAPSFKIEDHFATFKIYPPKNIQLVLHTGAKAKGDARAFKIEDPDKLLKWPASDRAVLTLASEAELLSQQASVQRILKQWVAQL